MGIVGLFIAPTTVITSLCYYFGYFATRRYFDYFGIDSDAIGFTTSDYVLRSTRALYLPVTVLLLSWVAALRVAHYLNRMVKAGRRTTVLRAVGWTAITLGGLGLVRGFLGMTLPQLKPDRIAALTPVGIGFGSACLAAGLWLLAALRMGSAQRPLAPTERASLLMAATAMVLSLFWLTNIYASFRGGDDAAATADRLWSRETNVVLDSTEPLGPPPYLIKESRLAPRDMTQEPTLWRYECFRTLVVHGDRWVLVPAAWTKEDGYAVIVTTGSSHRISLRKFLGISRTAAANHNGGWQCPEVAPS